MQGDTCSSVPGHSKAAASGTPRTDSGTGGGGRDHKQGGKWLRALDWLLLGGHRVREENKDDGERWIHSGLSTCFS